MTFPNQLSIVRIILAPVFLFLALSDNVNLFRVSFIVYFIATITDWYDGWYARKYKRVTRIGVFLDPFADKVLTTFAFIFFYIKNIMPLWMLIIIAMRDLIITLLRSYDEYKGKTLKTSYIAKVKTFIQMTYIFVILVLLNLQYIIYDDSFIATIDYFLYKSNLNYILLLLVTILTLYTGVEYIISKFQKIGNN
ncbi:MAG: CDP-diacylglycerol--glycerol-3-phosphate 3-phosphatidyltransferase [Ignavibacteria bacterium]|nr:CDP-diacylglycerol--glycerol-3-phosphate 3-phosphatidyltransferase [Ignavibacteria bacterium]